MNRQNRYFYFLLLAFLIVLFLIYGYIFPNLSPVSFPKKQNSSLLTAKDVQLFTEPDDGRGPILSAINSAKKSIDLEVYILSDKTIIRSLISAEKRGVEVRVILEEHPYKGYGANKETKDKLSHYGISTKWSNRVYRFTHSKFFVVDETIGYIMTLNLSKSSFTKNREFGIITKDPLYVKELERIFQSDWQRKPYRPLKSALVVSPENSRMKLTDLVKSAKKEILIYAEEIEDKDFEDLLVKKAKSGVKVYIVLANPEYIETNREAEKYLSAYHIQLSTPSTPFIHAKAIIVDNSIAYVGSINFSSTSMDKNREVGIITSSKDAVNKLIDTFFDDFR